VSEREFLRQVIEAAQALGFLVYHTHDSRRSQPGFPDLVMVRGYRLVALELKVGRRKPTPEQLLWLHALREVWQVDATWAKPEDWDSIMELLKRE